PPLPSGEVSLNVNAGYTPRSAAAKIAGVAHTLSSAPDTSEDGPLQLSLFDVAERHSEVIHKLHLPSPAETTLFFDGEARQHTNTMVVNTEEGLRVLIKSLYNAGAFALDTETSSEEPRLATLVGCSLAMA